MLLMAKQHTSLSKENALLSEKSFKLTTQNNEMKDELKKLKVSAFIKF
jgi:hypothetical protein